jgi:membrane protease YdiL (CAAX protease family)
MEETAIKRPKNVFGVTLIYLVALYIAWIGAWMLSQYLERQSILPATELVRFVYWTILRLLVWVLPSCFLIWWSGRKLRDVLSLGDMKRILLWGGGFGALAALSIVLTRTLAGRPLFSFYWNASVLTALVVGPIVEEITFRGVVLDALQNRMKFWLANLITGFLFLLGHFPGWYFQGALADHLATLTGGGLTILILGWIFGFVTRKSRSVSGSILTHVINNFFSTF